jgi:hypothetical protein
MQLAVPIVSRATLGNVPPLELRFRMRATSASKRGQRGGASVIIPTQMISGSLTLIQGSMLSAVSPDVVLGVGLSLADFIWWWLMFQTKLQLLTEEVRWRRLCLCPLIVARCLDYGAGR